MEFYELLAKRRMYRHFSDKPVPQETLDRILDSATRGPSAGYAQGFDFLVLNEPTSLQLFWELATTEEWREQTTTHKGLWKAPIVILPLANPSAYTQRYSEEDKSYAQLNKLEDWPAPFWHVDTAFASMLILQAVVNENLGALFLGLFRNAALIKISFGIPDNFHPIGAIVIGHPTSDMPGASSKRGKRAKSSQFHFNRF